MHAIKWILWQCNPNEIPRLIINNKHKFITPANYIKMFEKFNAAAVSVKKKNDFIEYIFVWFILFVEFNLDDSLKSLDDANWYRVLQSPMHENKKCVWFIW